MAQTAPSPRSLDQFFTRSATAETCLALLAARLPDLAPDLYVEPAAGDGAFLERLPEPRFGLDIAPSAPGMETGDFLNWLPDESLESIAVVGNPPFGRNAAKAIAFFNHAAGFAEVIALILPASLMKGSMQDRLDPQFHLVDELPLPAEPFRVGERLCQVNTVFQIWRRESFIRPKSVRSTEHDDFRFVATAAEADFVVRRVGARAGALLPRPEGAAGLSGYSPSSNLFVQATGLDPKDLEARFGKLDFAEVRQRVAANPSVSKTDIVALYEVQMELERIAEAAAQDVPVHGGRSFSPHLVPPARAKEGDLVAMIVHHGRSDDDGAVPLEAVDFRRLYDLSFVPVLHTALRGPRRRQAKQLLEDLFARRGPWRHTRAPHHTTSILFHDAILHLGPPGVSGAAMEVEMAPCGQSTEARAARARHYQTLTHSWLGTGQRHRMRALARGSP